MDFKLIIALALGAVSASAQTPITRERAIDFLYSTMALPDSADYPRSFYLSNVDASLQARREMPWGESVPEREFLHFVLPVRVNNENLDFSRPVFYQALKDRVKGLSMKDAILEVNHWCHELATYRPSDGRTSSPLSTVSQAIGRCGEESTFTVAALRSVGIPARQIYTPRWAHTDDNHAWVEAWADGEWHFLGACEPEPVLDLAWFNAPASRGLLMNTDVAGRYDGPEEVLESDALKTRINVTSNYAPVATLPVEAVYPDGKPADGAKVCFCIYNYSEYFPTVAKRADKHGRASLLAGLGDIIVWATDGKKFGVAKGSPRDYTNGSTTAPLKVTLDKDASWQGSLDFDIIPPAQGSRQPLVTPAMREANDRAMQREDSTRNAYMRAAFVTPETATEEADRLGVDREALVKIMGEARGNGHKLLKCLASLSDSRRAKAIALLMNVSEKDRRDITPDVIIDHINNTPDYATHSPVSREVYDSYILSPRIETEGLRPWRGELIRTFTPSQAEDFRNNPGALASWVESTIAPADGDNPKGLRMSPISVLTVGRADGLSRNIFFVAMARTLGIPSRIDPVTGDTQYMDTKGNWISANIGKAAEAETPAPSATAGKLYLSFTPVGHIVDPKYYSQFSLSRIVDGVPRQLEFDEDGTVCSLFAEGYPLEAGQYVLTSGQRLANGGVLAHSEIFTIRPDETVKKELKVRHEDGAISVIGSLNAENIYHDTGLDTDKSLLSTTGRGYYVLGLLSPNHEPSTHALNDLAAVATQLDVTGRKVMLLFDTVEKASRFNKDSFPGLPSTVTWGIDNDGASRREIVESLHLGDIATDPVFVIADTFNRVVWASTGYTIGIGEAILSVLSQIN